MKMKKVDDDEEEKNNFTALLLHGPVEDDVDVEDDVGIDRLVRQGTSFAAYLS